MGCKDHILLKALLRNCKINSVTFEENTEQPFNDNLNLLRALALPLHGNQKLKEATSKLLKLCIKGNDGLSPHQFQGVHVNEITVVEDLLLLNILLYDMDFVDRNIVGEFARRNVQKYENTVRLLRPNNHICHVSNINAVLQ